MGRTALSDRVVYHLERLGARYAPKAKTPRKIEGHALPEALRAFFDDVTWPRGRTYLSHEDSDLWVWSVSFLKAQWLDEEDFAIANRDGRPLVTFGHTDGGNYLLLADLSAKGEPRVMKIDHHDPEQTIDRGLPLADFLSILYPETGAWRSLVREWAGEPADYDDAVAKVQGLVSSDDEKCGFALRRGYSLDSDRWEEAAEQLVLAGKLLASGVRLADPDQQILAHLKKHTVKRIAREDKAAGARVQKALAGSSR